MGPAGSGPRATRSTPRRTLLEAEARLLEAGRQIDGPAASHAPRWPPSPGPTCPAGTTDSAVDQALAIQQIATSGRRLDVFVGPAGTGKSTTMAGLRAVWEAEHGPGSVLGLAPSAAAAEVLAAELGIDTENIAKWLFEHRREAERLARSTELRSRLSVLSPLGPGNDQPATELAQLSRTGPLAAPSRTSW